MSPTFQPVILNVVTACVPGEFPGKDPSASPQDDGVLVIQAMRLPAYLLLLLIYMQKSGSNHYPSG